MVEGEVGVYGGLESFTIYERGLEWNQYLRDVDTVVTCVWLTNPISKNTLKTGKS
jgi:hypothetical protein